MRESIHLYVVGSRENEILKTKKTKGNTYCDDDVLRYLGSRPFCLVVVVDSPVHFLSIVTINQMKFNYLLNLQATVSR